MTDPVIGRGGSDDRYSRISHTQDQIFAVAFHALAIEPEQLAELEQALLQARAKASSAERIDDAEDHLAMLVAFVEFTDTVTAIATRRQNRGE